MEKNKTGLKIVADLTNRAKATIDWPNPAHRSNEYWKLSAEAITRNGQMKITDDQLKFVLAFIADLDKKNSYK